MIKPKTGKCLVPDCKNTDVRSRGLCASHYSYISLLVRSGKYTWEELESRGRVLKRNNAGCASNIQEWLDGGDK